MISLALALLLQASTADAVSTIDPAVPEATQPKPATGKIIVYRGSSIVGAALGCPVRYKEQEIVELGRGKYAEFDVAPGRYILTNKTSAVEVIVDPGEVRYVRCMIKTGMLTGRADLQIVDKESFAQHQTDYERKEVSFIFAQ